jgi:hypothetical protein
MRYLGSVSGNGVITCDGEELSRARYDFDGFYEKPAGITSNGEIRMPPEALNSAFAGKSVQLRTDDGQLLTLKFSDKKLAAASHAAHVDVTGKLFSDPRV